MTASEMGARRAAVVRDGRRAAEELRDPNLAAPPLIELASWLPELTDEAFHDALLAPARCTLQAASAWLSDTALATDADGDATAARARACELARVRLATFTAHEPSSWRLAAVTRCAHELARALDPCTAHAPRRDAIIAVHAELLSLAIRRSDHSQPLPAMTADSPHAHWGTRRAAALLLSQAGATAPLPTSVMEAVRRDLPTGDALTGIVAELPALTLDAIRLDLDGAGLDPRSARGCLQRAHERAATTLHRIEQALAGADPDTRPRQTIGERAHMRL